MEPAPARETWWKGQPLSEHDFKELVAKHVKAFRVDGDRVVVVVSTSNPNQIANVIVCTRPPCWP